MEVSLESLDEELRKKPFEPLLVAGRIEIVHLLSSFAELRLSEHRNVNRRSFHVDEVFVLIVEDASRYAGVVAVLIE